MNKKGQGISINVIIIAAIALLVLVILAVLLLRTTTKVDTSLKDCTPNGGTCQANYCANPDNEILNTNCPTDKSHCCKIFTL